MVYTNYDELLHQIGQNLRIIRTIRKEKLQGVGKSIGISHPVLSKIENGHSENLTLALLIRICNHYNVTLQQVLTLETSAIFQFTQHNQNPIVKEIENVHENVAKQFKL